ncbi:Hypothetical_protein [Hexamita inflata]|uniref:Hypothetical_protein n=1 Tax=Hexamita inflata TaxID=28002 RepID=A0AA86QYE3_9EUKA|nr:Hypothetical protein HINF_LOCUS51146 [Hexamita inflata]
MTIYINLSYYITSNADPHPYSLTDPKSAQLQTPSIFMNKKVYKKYGLKTARFALTYRPFDIFWEINRGSVSEQGWGSAFEVMQYNFGQLKNKFPPINEIVNYYIYGNYLQTCIQQWTLYNIIQ